MSAAARWRARTAVPATAQTIASGTTARRTSRRTVIPVAWQALGESGLAVFEALPDFLHGVRSFRHGVLKLDRRRELPLALLHQLENVLERRLARAPRQIQRAVGRRRAVLQVHARDPVVVLVEEVERRAAD